MSELRAAGSKRPRGRYSRLICLGCRERRIRCEFPGEVEIPEPGELRTVRTPCYRCKRLDIPCSIRRTILGRPGAVSRSTTVADFRHMRTGDNVSRAITELSTQTVARTHTEIEQDDAQQLNTFTSPKNLLPSPEDPERWGRDTLLIHTPQSAETVLIIRAVDTLRRQRVENEWFRHLAVRVGQTPALDLSIKAMIAACAYARGVPKMSLEDCYEVLTHALKAVQANVKHSHGEPNDHTLASAALLAPFEGVIREHGIPTRPHVDGVAAVLAARPATHPVTQLAREIFDYYACESAIVSFIHGTPSCFEGVDRAYFANDKTNYIDSDQAQLKGLGNELFIRIPRLVMLVRTLRLQSFPQKQLLLAALRLSTLLGGLQDFQAEERLGRNIKLYSSSTHPATSYLRQSLHFSSPQDFEALICYWHSRLSLLRLDWRLHDMSVSGEARAESIDEQGRPLRTSFSPMTDEIFRLMKNILMCSEYVGTLPLRRHLHLLAYAMITVRGVTRDLPESFCYPQDREEIRSFPDMSLQCINHALAAKPNLTIDDIDIAADIFVGGQLKGRFAELYDL